MSLVHSASKEIRPGKDGGAPSFGETLHLVSSVSTVQAIQCTEIAWLMRMLQECGKHCRICRTLFQVVFSSLSDVEIPG